MLSHPLAYRLERFEPRADPARVDPDTFVRVVVDGHERPRQAALFRGVAFITEPRVVRKILDHLHANANRERAPPTP